MLKKITKLSLVLIGVAMSIIINNATVRLEIDFKAE